MSTTDRLRRAAALLAVPALASMLMAAAPAGTGPEAGAVASARTFAPYRPDPLAEATSTRLDDGATWGGIETLDVPATPSAGERAAARAAARTPIAPAPSAADIPAPDGSDGAALAAYAVRFAGSPYMAGGNTPAGWDCSGFTQWIYARFGVSLPHGSDAQAAMGTPVSDPMPGDLMVGPGHAGIYIGNGMMVHAMNPVDGTRVTAAFAGMAYYRLLK
ncbi:C40 family peptidase [Bifidobacterium myosotis]|uniref:C40 family peptidase n=1 Tax=Bifidobacterium myosotis TaxID=1630166 RepID=UPI001CC2B9BC|nr:C40 family peptidase [Bifidobacterium myosotis]